MFVRCAVALVHKKNTKQTVSLPKTNFKKTPSHLVTINTPGVFGRHQSASRWLIAHDEWMLFTPLREVSCLCSRRITLSRRQVKRKKGDVLCLKISPLWPMTRGCDNEISTAFFLFFLLCYVTLFYK